MRAGGRVRRFTAALSAVLALSLHAANSEIVPFERDFTVRVWRKEHGLPDDRVLSLLEDHNGFLWVGTRKGVSRFDGRHFKTWSRSTHDIFSSEECNALAEDREGVVWVGTSDRLIRLGELPASFQMASVEPRLTRLSDIPQNWIWTLCASESGELFIGTQVGIVNRRADGSWQRVVADPGLSLYWAGTALAATPDGTAWVGAGAEGLFRREQPDALWTKDLNEPEFADRRFVHALGVTRDGSLHAIVSRSVSDPYGQLIGHDATGWKPMLDFEISVRPCIPFLTPDSAGGLWFPVTNRVVGRLLDGSLTQYALPRTVSGLALFCMVEDAEGNLWAGTAQDGLACLLPRRIRTLTAEDGLPDPRTRALLEASDGTLWLGTDGGAVQMGGNQPRVLNKSSGLGSDLVRALAEDAQGRVCVGTVSGLSVWDGQTLEPVVYPGADYRTKIRALLRENGFPSVLGGTETDSEERAPPVPDSNPLQSPNRVSRSSALRRGRSPGQGGALWVGTAQGLYRLGSDQTNGWLVVDGLPHGNVCVVHQDRRGQVWIGTDGGGLARCTDKGFERFDESSGLSSLRVYALYDDAEGALWIGTDRGLNLLIRDRIAVLTTVNGLPDNLVNGIVEDRHGWLWIGHDRGVYRVRRQELIEIANGARSRARCISYAEEDGLLNPETNGQNSYPPAIRLRDGRIGFATMGGVALFDPDAPPDLTNGPCASIEALRAGGYALFPQSLRGSDTAASDPRQPSLPPAPSGGEGRGKEERIAATPDGSRFDRSANPMRRLAIQPRDRGLLTVEFTVAAFRAPERVRCQYRLLGLSPEWTDAGTLRQATFTSLRPGDYTFEVSALNHHGYASTGPARLNFRVEPRWHERGLVRVGGAVGLLAAVAAAVRWRLMESRRLSRLEQQAALARERARLAKDLHDGLGASLTEITLLSGVGEPKTLSAEDIAARFDRLSRRTHDALHSLRDLIWTTNPKADSLELLVSRVCGSAESALDAAGLRCRLDFPTELPQVALGPEVRKALLLATSEAVNNAIRHAQAKQVTLRFCVEAAGLVLEVEDDGQGFDTAEAQRRRGTGDHALGLASMRERMVSLGGQCEVQTRPGAGTRVTFRVPLPSAERGFASDQRGA